MAFGKRLEAKNVTITINGVIESLFEVLEVKEQGRQVASLLWDQLYCGRNIAGIPAVGASNIVRKVVHEVEEDSLSGYMECSNLKPNLVGVMIEIGDEICKT
jgi:hypothetical protein